MKTMHAIYFDGTTYFVDAYDADYDKEELELIKKGFDLDALDEEANSLTEQAYD